MVIEIDDEKIEAYRALRLRRYDHRAQVYQAITLAAHVLERADAARARARTGAAHGLERDSAPPSLRAMDSDRGLVG